MDSTKVHILKLLAACCVALGPWSGSGSAGDPPVRTVTVLVAQKDIRAGTKLGDPEKLFKKVSYLVGYQPKRSVSDFYTLYGKVLTQGLEKNQPLLEQFLADEPGLISGHAKEMRAFTIKLSSDSLLWCGLALPGSKVDVVLIEKRERQDEKCSVVVENVLLLDLSYDVDGIKQGFPPGTATLELTSEQALKLIRASTKGSFYLPTRPFGDDPVQTVTVLVARQDLAAWTRIKDPEKLFEHVRRTKGEETRYAVSDFSTTKNMIAVRPLKKGQLVVSDDLVSPKSSGPDESIPRGKRAVAIRISKEAGGLGKFLLPGCRVDVIATTDKQKETQATFLMKNLLVRDADQSSGLTSVEVTPEQAFELAKAKDKFTFHLVLRPQ